MVRTRNKRPVLRLVLAALAVTLIGGALLPALPAQAGSKKAANTGLESAGTSLSNVVPDGTVRVLVQAAKGKGGGQFGVWAAVRRMGGTVEMIDGTNPDRAYVLLPADQLPKLRDHLGVLSVDIQLGDDHVVSDRSTTPYDPLKDPNSLFQIAQDIGATKLWNEGYTGGGIDVAVIDSGVAPLKEFRQRLVNGPDLSFDADPDSGVDDEYRGMDMYGHGTHMAGIIAGLSPALPLPKNTKPAKFVQGARKYFSGIAPSARIINIKAGAADGAVDVSQIIAGIYWVIEHAHDKNPDGSAKYNIRVLNLSFGTDGTSNYMSDPLAYAVEEAWRAGIVVVTSAGNDGNVPDMPLNNPAYDPYVIAVGATDSLGTRATGDDRLADFTSLGVPSRRPDVLAPGTSTTSLRVPGSMIDRNFPQPDVNHALFKGTGTSQAAAVVSGAVALVLSKYEDRNLTPDQVKALLMDAGSVVKNVNGKIDAFTKQVKKIDLTKLQPAISKLDHKKLAVQDSSKSPLLKQANPKLDLEVARGSHHVSYVDENGVEHELRGNVDVTGQSWDGAKWKGALWRDEVWSGAKWRGATWRGATWRARGWTGSLWRGSVWAGAKWRNERWLWQTP